MEMILLNKSKQYSDTEIIAEIVAGNHALFEIIIRRYNSFLYKAGRGYGFNHHDTEDLMQDTYINCFQNLSKFENRSAFKTWLIKIMLNQCHHKANKFSFQKEKPAEVADLYSNYMFSENNHTDTGNTILNKELKKVIEGCIDKLQEEYRLTFTLRELVGLNVAETAEIMNTTSTNVKVRLNRAKAMLRKEIEKEYVPENIYEFNAVNCDRIVNNVMKKICESEVH